jgi:hypothetical protein
VLAKRVISTSSEYKIVVAENVCTFFLLVRFEGQYSDSSECITFFCWNSWEYNLMVPESVCTSCTGSVGSTVSR